MASRLVVLALVTQSAALTLPAHAARPARSCASSMSAAAEDSLQVQLKNRMKLAMKKGPDGKQELGAVRLINAALTTKAKEDGSEAVADDIAVAVLKKLAKMRKESIEMYEKANADEKVASEKFELDLISEYLPAMADEATVRGWIAAAVAEACPDGPDKKLMGKVMGALNKAHGGEFDNKSASGWVKEALS